MTLFLLQFHAYKRKRERRRERKTGWWGGWGVEKDREREGERFPKE